MTDLRTPTPATSLSPQSNHRIVLFGAPGTGKTAQILTLPRPIFVYTFEASALATLQGARDVHILEFFPRKPSDAGSLAAKSIMKGGRVAFDFLSGEDRANAESGLLYTDFYRDVAARLEADWWRNEGFVTLALDGLSTMASHLLNRVQSLQAQVKSDDRRTDYMQAGNTARSVFGYLSTQTPIFITTLHTTTSVNETTGAKNRQLNLPGSARAGLPTISTICWRTMLAKEDMGKGGSRTRFCAQTFPDREYDWIRPGPFQLPDTVDLTIDDWGAPERFGIGGLIGKGAGVRKVK